jgi:Ca2+-transporting ATPase
MSRDTVAWHRKTVEETASMLGTSLAGLAATEAASRLERGGPNELADAVTRGPLRILAAQASSVMVLLLIVSAGVSAAIGKWTELAAILAIVVLFIVLGFVQEYRAERSIASLKRLSLPAARVIRDGSAAQVSSRELVPGDLLLLEAGNMLPADVRFVECASLQVQEAALTGESLPVDKDPASLPDGDLLLADRRNLGFRGTTVTHGRASAYVVATGMGTELGTIARLIREAPPGPTPLQRRLARLARAVAVVAAAASAVIFATGVALGEQVRDMIVTAISVAVAAIPEGLPAVVTVTLALGARRMLRRQALIRSLPAVETLGSVTVICTDKTGTLTENRMTVTVVDVAGHRRGMVEPLLHGQAQLTGSEPVPGPGDQGIGLVLAAGALCNDAMLVSGASAGSFHAIGDPTEGALVVAAARGGLRKADLEAAFPRVAEAAFDSARRRMTTVHARPRGDLPRAPDLLDCWAGATGGRFLVLTKGSVDSVLPLCRGVWDAGAIRPIDAGLKARIVSAAESLAAQGTRVLGTAFRFEETAPGARADPEALERDLVFAGMVGMMDPPRPEVRDAIRVCREAGIRVVMITGDHPLTAETIARDLALSPAGSARRSVTGAEIDAAREGALAGLVEGAGVFARVSPEHKLRIVEALQGSGETVAMTGDGVNDAPALRRADIGVAMGITGTDVAKDAADMVLADDNFVSIVAAVKEGRVIVDNIRRFVVFSVAGNLGKVLLMLAAPLFGIPVALYPLQLLWLNLLTDGLLGLAMGFEPADPGVMRRGPASTRGGILPAGSVVHIAWLGVAIAALTLGTGVAAREAGRPEWRTMIFAVLGFLQVWEAFAARSEHVSAFRLRAAGNPVLLVVSALVVGAQAAVLTIPGLSPVFSTTPLSAGALAGCALIGLPLFFLVEAEKLVMGRRRNRRHGHES